jgi:hypothetical protein
MKYEVARKLADRNRNVKLDAEMISHELGIPISDINEFFAKCEKPLVICGDVDYVLQKFRQLYLQSGGVLKK